MRTLCFVQVTDSRLDENPKELLEERIKQLEERLNIEGVTCTHTDPKFIDWSHTEEGGYQWRSFFYVKKNTRKVTWNDIYDIVNSVHAAPYEFI